MKKKLNILVVDDDIGMARTLRDIFVVKGYRAEAVFSAPEALERIKKGDFDCALMDIKMPIMDGVELYQAIKSAQYEFPVVLMTAYSTDSLVKEGLDEGALAVLSKPLDINQLLAFFASLSKERSIVIVDDDPQFCRTLGDILRERSFAVAQYPDPEEVIDDLKPDGQIVLLDMKLGDNNGLDVLKEVRKRYPDLPVILVTGYREEMAPVIEAALKIKAYACLYKPFEIEELIKIINEIHHRKLGTILGREF